MANYMIYSRDMHCLFWDEVVNYTNYIQNHMPHKVLRHITSEEACFHVKPDVYLQLESLVVRHGNSFLKLNRKS